MGCVAVYVQSTMRSRSWGAGMTYEENLAALTLPLFAGSFFIYQTLNGMDTANIARILPHISLLVFIFRDNGCWPSIKTKNFNLECQ
ncbi:protein of unknown function (plasmid) [Cupriavidus taiwanensis]|nr:protein of unknown function [Cupriavidus taiwanensis]SPA03400.1 protein of unknown function [Cupriavidus taiwanensis]